jgi:hypothetical protein
MTQHRFLNDGRSPIPMGGVAEYACVCGKRGAYAAIERHIDESAVGDEIAHDVTPTAPYKQVVDVNDFGGDTMAHYLPNAPRKPAPTGESPPLQRPERPAAPEPLSPPSTSAVDECSRSIAELFQDKLRHAFQAGGAAAASGESFETWYQREVLR